MVSMINRAFLLLVLLCAACGSAEPNAVALIVAYRGPTDKYVPCIVLSDVQHSRAAVALGEKADCRAFTAIIGTTNDSDFFVQVDKLGDGSRHEASTSSMLFVTLDRAGQRKDVELDVADGLTRVRALAKYFPEISERIETDFVRRLELRTPVHD